MGSWMTKLLEQEYGADLSLPKPKTMLATPKASPPSALAASLHAAYATDNDLNYSLHRQLLPVRPAPGSLGNKPNEKSDAKRCSWRSRKCYALRLT
jgi:hypothetical protein